MLTIPSRRMRLLGAVAAVALVTGGGATWALARTTAAGSSSTPPAPVPTPVLAAVTTPTGSVSWEGPLRVTVTNATLRQVTVTDPQGQDLYGGLAGGTWTSTAGLSPATSYQVRATVVDQAGRSRHLVLTAR